MGAGKLQRAATLTDGRYGDEWWREGVVYQVYPAQLRRHATATASATCRASSTTSTTWSGRLGVDAIWLSPIYPVARAATSATTSATTRPSTRCFGTRGRLRPPRREAHRARHPGDPRPRHEPHQRRARLVPGEPGVARRARTPTGTCGATRPASTPTARRCRRTTGCRSSAARPGSGSRRGSSSTCTRSSSEQPELNWRNPAVEAAQCADGPRLARPRRRRLPPRRLQRVPQAPRAAVQPGASRATRRGTARSTSYDRDQPDFPELIARFRAIVDEEPGPDVGRRAVRGSDREQAARLVDRPPPRLRLGAPVDAPWSAQALPATCSTGGSAHLRRRPLADRSSSRTTTSRARRRAWPRRPASPTPTRSRGPPPHPARRCAARPFLYYGEEIGLRDVEVPVDEIIDPPARRASWTPEFPGGTATGAGRRCRGRGAGPRLHDRPAVAAARRRRRRPQRRRPRRPTPRPSSRHIDG